ncbi:MAG: hypothetical protein M3Q32_00640 [Pseudomonadota bacterium]|nr:hypothetical protein [Pseudomonadota bacterium]
MAASKSTPAQSVLKWRQLIEQANAEAKADDALFDREVRVRDFAASLAKYAFINRWAVRANCKASRPISVPGMYLFHRVAVREGACGSASHLLARLCIHHLHIARELWRKGDHEKAEVAIERATYTSEFIKSAFASSYARRNASALVRAGEKSKEIAASNKTIIEAALKKFPDTALHNLTAVISKATRLKQDCVRTHLQEMGILKKKKTKR